MKTILLPVDDSEASMKAARFAVEIAADAGANVEVLHVLPSELALYGFNSEGYYCANLEHVEKKWEMRGRKLLDRIARTPHGNVKLQTRLEKGYASKIILNLAGTGGYNMIIMGSRGLGPLERAFRGSVSNAVVNHSPCPVVVVH